MVRGSLITGIILSVLFFLTLGETAETNNESEGTSESAWPRNETRRDILARYYGDDYENFRACVYDKQYNLCCSDNVDQVAIWRSQNTQDIYEKFERINGGAAMTAVTETRINAAVSTSEFPIEASCGDYFDYEYCAVMGEKIHMFDFNCPPGIMNSDDHYCLKGESDEPCCTNNFKKFTEWVSKGCVENCPKHIDPAERGPYDDAIFYKDVEFGFCCDDDCKGIINILKNQPTWVYAAGGSVLFLLTTIFCSCRKKKQQTQPIQQSAQQPVYVQQPYGQQQPMAGATIVINNNMR